MGTPYSKDDDSPFISVEASPVSRPIIPLICFDIVKIRQANWVMRQFWKTISMNPLYHLHKEDMKGRTERY